MIERMMIKLHNLEQNTLDLYMLQKWCDTGSYASFAELVVELERRKAISPVKASGTNGCNPPLYMKYRILHDKKEMPSFDTELDSMHYWINTEPLRRNLKNYQKNRAFLLCLSDFLKKHSDTLSFPMSENERAYAIWGDEKALDDKKGKKNMNLLKKCGVWEHLNTYPTPEPFFDYRRNDSLEHILVIENKDTWFTLRRLMMEFGIDQFFDVPVDCLVYGEGNKITQRNSSLEQYLNIDKPFHGTVWYWGDLDPKGIGFFLSARTVNATLRMKPFLPAYLEMLNQFEKRLAAPHSETQYRVRTNQKHPEQAEEFYAMFPEHVSARLHELLDQNYYIPQEILHYQLLKTSIRMECTV